MVMLVPGRIDTAWYHSLARSADAVAEWRGRLKFRGAPSCAPFPSVVFYWGDQVPMFNVVFGDVARCRSLHPEQANGR
jgi:hypothetical protein